MKFRVVHSFIRHHYSMQDPPLSARFSICRRYPQQKLKNHPSPTKGGCPGYESKLYLIINFYF